MTDDPKKLAQGAWDSPGWSETAKEFDAARPPIKAAPGRLDRASVRILDLRTDEEIEAADAKAAAERAAARAVVDKQELIEELARKDAVEYDRARIEAADRLGVRVGTLDEVVGKQRKKPPPPEDEPVDIARLEATAGELLTEPDILAAFGRDVESAGLVGETNNAKILYLALTSRRFGRPVSVAIKGVSAGGKSFTVESVLKFFPPSAYFSRTGCSEKALYFSNEDFRNRFIVLFEMTGMASDYLSYVVRTLLSENRLSYELPMKSESGLEPRVLEKEGPA
jgi:hypothetical protein